MRTLKRLRWRMGFAQVVLRQLRTERPPEVLDTYRRLSADGIAPWEAYRLLVAVHEAEVASMLSESRVYDHGRFVGRLTALPTPPPESLATVPVDPASHRSGRKTPPR